MSGAEILVWIHVLGWAAYFGAQFAVIYMLMPAAESAPDEAHRRASLIAGFKFYNPFSIGMLGIVVITGAMRLTDLKAEMKFDYFARIGEPLALKLGLAFLLIFIQSYITFGLSFRIGRQEEVAAHGDGPAFTIEQLNSMLRRIRAMIWVTIVLTAAVVLVSLTIVRRASADPGAPPPISTRAALDAGFGARIELDGARRISSSGEREERADDIGEGHESKHHARQLGEEAVLRVADVVGRRAGISRGAEREIGTVGSRCVHGRILPMVTIGDYWSASREVTR
ncbi:MAG TPA: hypothetical protein VMV27_02240 [Candidatus Binataceae bacterium]|nr:hypothetical protein [Candidatus Binataceae bacterium]